MARKGKNSRKTRGNNNTVAEVRHPNRNTDKGESRVDRGNRQLIEDQQTRREDYDLSWFKPTEKQKEIVYSMCVNDLTMVQGGSGCGKSTTAIWQALKMLKDGDFKKILLIKTASEDSPDMVGYLSGDLDSKLNAHMVAMRSIFTTFMSKAKLEMEEKRERIEFGIPNFIAGRTFYDTIVLIEESQKIDQGTMKLIVERLSDTSICVLLGDKGQRYSSKKREDGFTKFVELTTAVDEDGRYSKEDLMGYVEMTSADNMRGRLSRRIGELFEENEQTLRGLLRGGL